MAGFQVTVKFVAASREIWRQEVFTNYERTMCYDTAVHEAHAVTHIL